MQLAAVAHSERLETKTAHTFRTISIDVNQSKLRLVCWRADGGRAKRMNKPNSWWNHKMEICNSYNDLKKKKTKNDETIHGMINMTLTTLTDYISCITDNERLFCGLGSIILLSALEYLYTTRCLFKNCNANQVAIPLYPYKFLEIQNGMEYIRELWR